MSLVGKHMAEVPLISMKDLVFSWPKRGGLLATTPHPSSSWQIRVDEFSLAENELVFLHGASGSGKSTFLNLLAGILQASSGQIQLGGQDLVSLSWRQKDRLRAHLLGIIFQQFNLLPFLTVMENVLIGSLFSSPESYDIKKRAASLLNSFEFSPKFFDRQAGKLSVGQQQRVAAARAFLGSPKLILADEPTSALDATLRDEFMRILMDISQDRKIAVIMVSHDHQLSRHFSRVVAFEDLITVSESS